MLGATLIFLYHSTEDPRIVRVILAPRPCNFRRIEKKKRAMLIFQPIPTFLELCVSALHRGHANMLQVISHVSQIVRVIQAGAMLLFFFFKKKTVCTYHPWPCKISLRNSRKNVQLIPCGRENRHSRAGSPNNLLYISQSAFP